MKKVSHSEISTYLDCQKKWELIYQKGLKIDNIHFQFGSMGHKVLETEVIPDETLYPELKEAFQISSWNNYFVQILNEIHEWSETNHYKPLHKEYHIETDEIVGVIDVVWVNTITNKILITDYKFSNSDKDITDVLLDEQMYIYAVAYAHENKMPLDNIEIGYINISKQELGDPRVLKNGTLSKDKAQSTSYQKYLAKIKELNLNEADYTEVLDELKNKTATHITISSINVDMAYRIMNNLDNTIKDMQKGYVLEKCSYLCKKCEYLEYCKYGRMIKNDIF